MRVERGHHQFAHLAFGDRVTGAGTHDLDNHAFVNDQTLAGRSFVSNQAQVGRGIALVHIHTLRAEPFAQAGWAGFAADQALPQRGHIDAGFLRLFQQDAQKAGRAAVTLWLQVDDGGQLLLGLASTGRKYRTAHRMRARLHHEGAGGHVIAEAVVHQVPRAKAGRVHGATDAPVVLRRHVGLVNRAG